MSAATLFSAGRASPRIKVCCIASIAEAELALHAGADAIGLVSAMPSGPGVIDDERIAELIEWAAGRIATVMLTSRQSAAGIGEQMRGAQPTVFQLVDHVPPSELRKLREQFPRVALMPVIHVTDAGSVEVARAASGHADAILLDSGNPLAAVKELGGTGRVHDWTISREIREATGVPLFLAGGLNALNVRAAIAEVEPFGVDVCSGVRVDGRLDSRALFNFVKQARS